MNPSPLAIEHITQSLYCSTFIPLWDIVMGFKGVDCTAVRRDFLINTMLKWGCVLIKNKKCCICRNYLQKK